MPATKGFWGLGGYANPAGLYATPGDSQAEGKSDVERLIRDGTMSRFSTYTYFQDLWGPQGPEAWLRWPFTFEPCFMTAHIPYLQSRDSRNK